MLITITIFILILGLLIFVHELGHFVMARRNGIAAHEFGFGFPPRLVGVYRGETTGRWKVVFGGRHVAARGTIYSLNWIPLGGFVRIKGEDGTDNDPDSFATKSAWTRIKVLGAGVVMNFVLAWVLISVGFMIGIPQTLDTVLSTRAQATDAHVQVLAVEADSPAQRMGIGMGDLILMVCGASTQSCENIATVEDLQRTVTAHATEEIMITVQRGEASHTLRGTPRIDPQTQDGRIGVQIEEVALVRYPWYEAFWWGIGATYTMIKNILIAFGMMIVNLITGAGVSADLAGPVGIAYLTKQVTDLGISYLLQFAALLSINLGIINAVPFPALDGGRMLFVLIEKIKGSPVSRRVEAIAHSLGFSLLILLMIVVTFRDLLRFDILEKIKGLF